ncbi:MULTISPECIES: site-specific integrase [Bacillaceae]|nr:MULTISPECIES: site-specific integrase [Bacillaceae]
MSLLCTKNLDFKNNTISITKTLAGQKESMKKYKLGSPKTEKSEREIEMEQPIMDMLRESVRKNDEHKMRYRTIIDDFHDAYFVFARENGYPYFRGDVNKRIKRILRKAKIEGNVSTHIFRHTDISMLTEAGVDLPTIMQRVGHGDSKTTLEIYTHVTKKMPPKKLEANLVICYKK